MRTPDRTPITFSPVRASSGSEMAIARGQPRSTAGHRKLRAWAKPTDSEATDATRASHVIQPTSKPISSPNAVRA